MADTVRTGKDDATPSELRRYKHASAYYGAVREPLAHYFTEAQMEQLKQLGQEMAIGVEAIIERNKIRDWANNPDVHNKMKADIEDYLRDVLEPKYNVRFNTPDLDEILDRLIELAKQRDSL